MEPPCAAVQRHVFGSLCQRHGVREIRLCVYFQTDESGEKAPKREEARTGLGSRAASLSSMTSLQKVVITPNMQAVVVPVMYYLDQRGKAENGQGLPFCRIRVLDYTVRRNIREET